MQYKHNLLAHSILALTLILHVCVLNLYCTHTQLSCMCVGGKKNIYSV